MDTKILLGLGGVVITAVVMLMISTEVLLGSTGIDLSITEDFLANNTTYVPLAYSPILNVVNVSNATVLVPASNYTMNLTDGGIIMTNGSYNNQILRIEYVA